MELKPRLFTSIVYVNIVPNSTNMEEPSGRVLQESHPNWEAPHLEMPASTVPFPIHRVHEDVAQDRYSLFSLSIRNCPQENAPFDKQHAAEERRYPANPDRIASRSGTLVITTNVPDLDIRLTNMWSATRSGRRGSNLWSASHWTCLALGVERLLLHLPLEYSCLAPLLWQSVK